MADSAELFEAIAHPTRIEILKILEKEPSSFAALKRQLNLDSSGNLDHHLKKLSLLIKVQQNGLYTLTDAGKEALASVGAIETWKETELSKTKIKGLAKMPIEASFLVVLEFAVAVATLFLPWSVSGYSIHYVEPSQFNLLFPWIFVIAAPLGFLAASGLLRGRGWGWALSIIKAAFVVISILVPLYYGLHLITVSRQFVMEIAGFYPILSVYATFGIAESVILLIATRQPVKQFFGQQYENPLPRRVLAGGVLSVLTGLCGVYGGSAYIWSVYPFSGTGNQGLLHFFTGIAIAVGGILVLIRKRALGGIITTVFSLFPVPFYYIAWVFAFYAPPVVNLFVLVLVLAMPVASVLLIISNPMAASKAFLRKIWRKI